MARSGLRWAVADAAMQALVASQFITPLYRSIELIGKHEVYQIKRSSTTYVLTENNIIVATASIIRPEYGYLPCMEAFPEVCKHQGEKSVELGRPAKMIEIGALATFITESEHRRMARYLLATMKYLGPEIIRDNVDYVLVDVRERHAKFYTDFWKMRVFATTLSHPKDKQPAVCLYYDVIADEHGWLKQLEQTCPTGRREGGGDHENVSYPPPA